MLGQVIGDLVTVVLQMTEYVTAVTTSKYKVVTLQTRKLCGSWWLG